MTNVLIIEDKTEKFDLIARRVAAFFEGEAVSIKRSETLAKASRSLHEARFDVIIVDLMLPRMDGDTPQDLSEEIIGALGLAENNAGASVVALSGFTDLVEEQRVLFADAGILLASFDPNDRKWERQVDAALLRSRARSVFDFVVVCALDKERAGFAKTSAKPGKLRNIEGLDCLELQIGTLNGVVVKQPRMGLVNATAVTARIIEKFSPRLVSMSGICAGVPGEAQIGTLLVGDICWEYQAGKWSNDGFKPEHYDVGIDSTTRTTISQMIESDPKGVQLKAGLLEDAIVFEAMSIAPVTTGSAVIAADGKMDEIGKQHRKLAGLDMEMYGVYQAAALSSLRPIVFAAKVVVDIGDGKKSDAYHEYGCALSARFVVAAIEKLMAA